MTTADLKARANKQEPMPEGLNAAEQMYYVTVRHLYADYKSGKLPKEIVSREGAKAEKELENNLFKIKLMEHSVSLWKDMEIVSSKYAKEKTIENADKMYNTLYGLIERAKD